MTSASEKSRGSGFDKLYEGLRQSEMLEINSEGRCVTLVALIALAWSSPAFCGEIHDAARDGDVGNVEALLKGNPGLVLSMDIYGRTPLHCAAGGGHKNVAELLLASKADINARDKHGETPLHYAVEYGLHGHKDVAELLLANKADVNAKDVNGNTPLHYAAHTGHEDMAKLLLANNADVNARGNDGRTPLRVAEEMYGTTALATLLREHGGE